jgi:hypothetical protein
LSQQQMRLPLALAWRGPAQPQPAIPSCPSSVHAAVAKTRKDTAKQNKGKKTKAHEESKQKEEELNKQSICLKMARPSAQNFISGKISARG